MIGPCAKQVVRCTIVAVGGERIVATNHCHRPQAVCPRLPDEGYDKCRTVCRQPGHAEILALYKAGAKIKGATVYIQGHTYYCERCRSMLLSAGAKSLVVGLTPSV